MVQLLDEHRLPVCGDCSFGRPVSFFQIRVYEWKTHTHTHTYIYQRQNFGQLLMNQSLRVEIYRKRLKVDGSLDAREEEVKSEMTKLSYFKNNIT
jgi:hypothetical protein